VSGDPHTGFIVAAYAMAGLIVAGLVAWEWLDYRTQRRALASLDAAGVRRRSRPEAGVSRRTDP
jgi:heme exporter protein D